MQSGYRKVAAVVRSGIERGDFAPDTTLPKQTDIAHSFGVNVGTVRKAVALLEAEGLVTPVRRRGTVVRPRPPMRRPWARTDQTQTVHSVPADPEVAEAFGIETGQPVYERARLVKEGPTPTHMLTSYYLPEHVEGTPFVDPTPGPAGPGGGFAVLTIQGLEPHRMTETFFARMPTPDEMATLELPAGQPVMVLEPRTYTSDGRIVEYARGVHSASRFSWT
jgi:GntR family transcriptional regulator